ncbi:hypothetical protein BFJ63_vAg16380 [Fusarium oxysporum f. sp. narcissi]|uniref:Uncharacterized protein n=1 Tax=Fusarium oxysporum f. sp. narcissi TaxID=451672 RepID=A0A4Q2V979_FUSOX|nr:hypothetical protein BFJ63_vAg16380 [Fusarium oxysporum f. sp. narcissi]
MASQIIAQLKDALQGTESLAASLNASCLSPEAQAELDIIADKFRAVAILIGKKTQSFKPQWNDETWIKSKDHREKTEKILTNVLTENKLPNKQVLRNNLITIFCGPKKYMNDSQALKSRKIATEKRCIKLRQLSVNGIISWAIAYPSGTWAGGRMGSDIFDCLLQDIEPNDGLHWPPEVNETLAELQDGSYIHNEAFNKLAEGRDPIQDVWRSTANLSRSEDFVTNG